ncbi:MAG TPA: sulfotransferase, partial [Verrucomicrobiae bacterium]|nr:sulfotransferase [Verrucomicrobiae bacterium]
VSPTGANLVFLLSTPRSGSTLLGAMLANHSALYCPNEPWLLLNLYGLFDGKPHAMGTPNENLATVALRELLSEKQFSHAARAFALSVYNQKLQQQRKHIFVDKTPRYYQVLSFVDQLFPDAKKIWLQRNPFDVAASYAATWQVPVTELVGETLSPNSLDLTVGLRNYARYFRGQKNTFEIRYEDIVTNASEALQKLCAFLGVSYEPGLEDYDRGDPGFSAMKEQLMGDKNIFSHTRPHRQSVDKWKQHLAPEDLQRLINLIGEKGLKRMGYHDTVRELKAMGCRFPKEIEVDDALFGLEQRARAMPGESGAIYHLLLRTKTDVDKEAKDIEQLRRHWWVRLGRALRIIDIK